MWLAARRRLRWANLMLMGVLVEAEATAAPAIRLHMLSDLCRWLPFTHLLPETFLGRLGVDRPDQRLVRRSFGRAATHAGEVTPACEVRGATAIAR